MDWLDRIGRRLKLRDMHILLAVAEWGSIARAAERLAISQPVVSKAIAELERTVGVRLLDRNRLGAEPTPLWPALLRHGLAAFDELRQGVKEIEILADPTAGEVQIGATEAMVAGLLPVVIDRLYRRYPRLSVNITQAPTGAALYHGLRERTVDFVVGRLLSPTGAGSEHGNPIRGTPKRGGRNTEPLDQAPQDRLGRIDRGAMGLASTGYPGASAFRQCFPCQWPGHSKKRCGLQLDADVQRAARNRQFLDDAAAFGAPLRRQTFLDQGIGSQIVSQPGPVGIVTLQDRTLSPVAHLFIRPSARSQKRCREVSECNRRNSRRRRKN